MDIKNYIRNFIEEKPKYNLTDEDKKCIEIEGIGAYIYKKLTTTKYKSSSIPKDLEIYVKKVINYSIDNNLPIHIVFPFGAYKKWNLPTYPGIDWAELINIKYLIQYLSSVSEAYKKGVIIEYYSVELFVEKNNHLPQKDIDFYEKEFRLLMEMLQKYAPKGIQLKYTNLREEIAQKEALKAVDIKVEELRKDWGSLPNEEKQIKIKRAKVNCIADPSEPDYDKKIIEAVFVHDAFCSECWTKDGKVLWINKPDMVTIGNSYTGSWGIHIKSSRSSRVNFWIGYGAFIEKENSFIPTILTYSQLESLKDKIQNYGFNYFNNQFMNLNNIPVLSK